VKVAVSVKGRIHAFYLAQELQGRNMLAQLITSYPKFEVAKYGIDPKRVSSVLSTELLARAWRKAPSTWKERWDAQLFLSEHYEQRAARKLRPGADLFVGWSGVSLAAIRRAKKLGMTTVIERGSSHIEFQRDILRAEYESHAATPCLPHPAIVDKELREYEEADFISVPSEYARQTFIERGIPESKLLHAPYGVALESFKSLPKDDDVFRIIHVGACDIQKGCHFLLQAFHELDLPNAELWFVGGINPELEPWMKRYASPRVQFKGFQPQAKLKNFYAQASLFCLASIQEGLAVVVPQAMACGLPILASEHTGARDIVRDGTDGALVPARDVAALKERIAWFHANQDTARQMGQSALERVRTGFTWNDYGDRIVAAYTGALSANAGDGRAA